jgi:hypothetical protein
MKQPSDMGSALAPDQPRAGPVARDHPGRAGRHGHPDHRADHHAVGHSSGLRPRPAAQDHHPPPRLNSRNALTRPPAGRGHTPTAPPRDRSPRSTHGFGCHVCPPTAEPGGRPGVSPVAGRPTGSDPPATAASVSGTCGPSWPQYSAHHGQRPHQALRLLPPPNIPPRVSRQGISRPPTPGRLIIEYHAQPKTARQRSSRIPGTRHALNPHRPHRSLDQHPPTGPHSPTSAATVRPLRRDRLGGLVHEYLQVA